MDFYAAKRAARDAIDTARHGVDQVSDRSIETILAAVGITTPGYAHDERGRKIKVYGADVGLVLPPDVRDRCKIGPRTSYNDRGTVPGVTVAPTMKAARERTAPAYARGSRKYGSQVHEVDPSDLRYPIAVANPDAIIVTTDLSQYGDPIVVPISQEG